MIRAELGNERKSKPGAPLSLGQCAPSGRPRGFRHIPRFLPPLHSRRDRLQSIGDVERAVDAHTRRAYLRLRSLGVHAMVQYYTLEQAAQLLRISPEQLKEMARKKEIRAFQDRSGWRFRSQEIDEMARERGYGSDPELPLGEAAKAESGDSGAGN